MLSDIQIKVLVGCVIVIMAGAILVQGHPIAVKDLSAVGSYAVTGIGFLLILWERWLWSWWIFRRWLSKRPDLRGTWKGELYSNWVDPVTQQKRGPIEVYLAIRQTNSTIDVRLFSSESSSVSLSGHIFADSVGLNTLAITYENTPLILIRERSRISHGGMLLSIRGDGRPHQLDGEYWTDRSTIGQIKLTSRAKRISHDFDQATKVKYQTLTAPS